MKKRYVLLLCAAALSIGAACSSVSAHGVFIANRFDQKALVLGEGPTDNAYNPSCVKAVEAYDKNFDAMNVETVNYEDISPDKKIIEMIYTRLDAVKEVVYRNGTLRANFFRDIWRVEKVRKKFDAKEMVLFKGVLQEGKDKGVFCIDDVDMTASLVHYCVKGIEVPYIRGHIGANLDMETRKRYVANIVFGALHRTEI